MFHVRSVLRASNELLISSKLLSNNCDCYLQKISRCFSTDYEIKFKPQFSAEEHEKILNVLNTSSAEDLKRYKIPQNRIRNINSWRNKKGAFQSLNDVLEVDGLSVKVLEKLCENIISCNTKEPLPRKLEDDENVLKLGKRMLLYPPLAEINLSTAVALHIAPMGISWTRLSKDNHVDSWDSYCFSALPKKLLPSDTFYLVIKILEKLPSGDVYILESSNNNGGSLQSGKSAMLSTHQLELTSMLIAVINTSKRHNYDLQRDEQLISNKVYFLKSKLPARLFGTLVGQERVSAIKIITELLDGTKDPKLPYSSVSVEESLKNQFLAHTAVSREFLGQPLMLAITFMDIIVKRIPVACKAITFKGK